YFEAMRVVLERHGGTVEKFMGDAVMAVFGIPHIHEDDALRAVRAAVEMRTALTDLNGELEASWGVSIATRIGVNTGETIVSRSSAWPGWGSPGWWPRLWPRSLREPWSSPVGASPTATASRSGRWPRSSNRWPGSWRRTPPKRHGPRSQRWCETNRMGPPSHR